MSDLHFRNHRAAMTTRAISTLGDCPVWDAAVQSFLRCQALAKASDEFGPSGKAGMAFDEAKMDLEARYGRNYREHPEAKAALQAAHNAIRQAEQDQSDNFYTPMWEAERRLALTTPPTLNAALFKAELIEAEEIWNDSTLERDAFDIVVEDMARFAGEAQ